MLKLLSSECFLSLDLPFHKAMAQDPKKKLFEVEEVEQNAQKFVASLAGMALKAGVIRKMGELGP